MKVLKAALKEAFEKWAVWFASAACDMLDVRARPLIPWCCEEVPWLANEANMSGLVTGAMTPASDTWDRLPWLLSNMAEMSSSTLPIPMYSNSHGIDTSEILRKKNKYVEKDGGTENLDRPNTVPEFSALA